MSIPPGINPAFVTDLAARLQSHLSLPTANPYLTRNIIQIALAQPGPKSFILACKAFGRYQDSFLDDIFHEIKQRASSDEEAGRAHDLGGGNNFSAAESRDDTAAQLPGGLHVSKDDTQTREKRESKLGLERSAKRIRLGLLQEDEEEAPVMEEKKRPEEKVEFKKPALPVGRHIRERRIETPSHGGGLSQAALDKLRAHRERREPQHRDEYDNNPRDDRRRNDNYNSSKYTPANLRRNDPTPLRAPTEQRFANQRLSTARSARFGGATPRMPNSFDREPDEGIPYEDESALDRDWYASDELGHAFGDEIRQRL